MKVAFYLMNSKGLYVLQNFLNKFGGCAVEYVVGARDLNVQNDYFYEIKSLASQAQIGFYERTEFPVEKERRFNGYKFSVGWRWLIKNEENLIVFHDSLLPKYRGFAPLVNSLINNEQACGVTALLADAKYDCGDIIEQKSICFDYPLKIQDAIEKIEPLYFDLIDRIYQKLLNGKHLDRQEQDDSQATYSPWLDEEDYFINWQWSAEKIVNFVNAVGYPYNGAKARVNNSVVIFSDVESVNDLVVEHRERHIGKVLLVEDGCPVIICKTGMLKLIEIKTPTNEQVKINFRSRFC
ncbi:formyltransferase family protein [Thiopseudomonas acetoxidans]|uniref:Formyltransferase family protein n=1 Tax=Thiopseudomonas acetoxidans TaxID=3041622 RepID=A0ABT7SS71_9GAMM|nr:formyltransferase family protein [Thiopseudomonas sp. CY1220]MDM7858844.1 formyltransferase family protein [Thiopseudomonas sp. CY1220]